LNLQMELRGFEPLAS